MEDITAVVVEREDRTIGIPAISYIPFFHLAASGIDAIGIVVITRFGDETLDGRREKQPVGVRRVNVPELLELVDITRLGKAVKRQPKGIVGTQKTLGDIGSVHEVLPCDTPTEIIVVSGINGIAVRRQRPFAQLFALQPFGRIIIGQGQPRGNTCHKSAEALHIEHSAVAVIKSGAELRLHILLQFAFRHIFQYGLCHLVGETAPILTVGLRLFLLGLGVCSYPRQRQQENNQ